MNEVDYSPKSYIGNGITKEFSFDWKVFKNTDLIVKLIDSEDNETLQELAVDYTATIESVGGKIDFTTAPAEGVTVVIERKLPLYQSTGYSTSSGFQGSEIEKSFDRVSCNLQDMDYNIETFKTSFSSQTNDKIDANKADTDQQIEDNKADTDGQISAFEAEVNAKIQQVNEAVQKLNRLDEVLAECETFATNASNSSVSAEEQSIISQQQAVISQGFAEDAEQKLETFRQEQESAIANIQMQQATSEEQMYLLEQSLISQIQTLGIYMKGDRLFYKDSQGVEHEFRNDFGGIAPMAVKHKEIKATDEGFALTWSDPDDSTYQNNVYCTWEKTVIRRKLGVYPESPFDGEEVLVNTIRNQYAETAYIDEVDPTLDYKYRAFPCSTNRVYNLEETNKFGQWIYSFTRIMNESIPAEKIVYRGTNEHYRPAYMDFSSNTFNYGDWENAPFLLKDRLAPCAVGFDGELKYFLNPNNYKQKEDGTASDVTNASVNNNYFMRIKLLFRRKRTDAQGNTRVDISNVKVNEEYKPYGGFIKPDNTLREYIYLPIYRGSLISGKCRSVGGNQTPMSGQTAPNERNYCQANGAGHDMITYADRELIEDLFMLMFRHTDSQSVLGQGKSNGGNDVGACLKSGTMDDKGLCWGSTSTAEGIKFLGMENRYASQWERVLGEVLVNGVRKVKLGQGTLDGSTVEDFNFTGDGYITLSELPVISGTSGGYISKEQTVDDIGTFPVVVSGSSSTYECDGMWFNNSGTMVAVRGGHSYNGALCGVFCSNLNNPASASSWLFGSSVSFKPL